MRNKRNWLVIILVISILFVNSVNVFAKNTTPPAPTLSYSPTTLTAGNVTVTIYYPNTAVIKQYRLGANGIWTTYSAPVVISSNTYVYAQYQDGSKNWSNLGGYAISNIDKTPPSNPTFAASSTVPTNENVTVTIGFSSDSTIKQYKIGSSSTWTSYTVPVILTSNNIIYAKASDSVGNWTSAVSCTVSNIDKTAPSIPTLTADTVNPTNGVVNVSISYPADANVEQYKIGSSGTWITYSTPVVMSSNATLYAKAQDLAGNWSDEGSLAITNIDKTPPAAPTFTVSSTMPTNQNVTVNINFSADSSVKQYKIGIDSTWADYTAPVVVASNDVIYAKASDCAGNWTAESIYAVTNIDKTPPSVPVIAASSILPTNQSVTVSINFSSDSFIKQYMVGSTGVWLDYTEAIKLASNDTIYAKASDSAGNWTPEASYTVSNIDTTPPENPTITASTTKLTDVPVVVAINFSPDSTIKQYKIGTLGFWMNYNAPLALSSNTAVYAKSSDAVGNWSLEASYVITNIRKTVLGYTVKNYSTDMSSYNSIAANASSLNEITTATVSVDVYGNLTGAAPMDQINYANSNGIRTKLMISNNFNATIAKQLLESAANRQALKNNILNFLKTYNYTGVDIDIENIPAADRTYLTTLMSEIYSTLKPLGYGVSVAVQPKTYDSPNAAWNYAYDYKSLAENADFLMIMAYDEHYPGGTPGSIASIGWETSVVDYALTVVPKEKIILGMAAYGYDWVGTTTKSYSINSCYNLANQYGAAVNLDNTTKSKYFTYSANGISHTVWFEDGDTIAYKLDLANSRDLKGVGIWRLGLENTNYWITIKAKLNK
jgi:spore germination protein YaaH